MNKHLLDIPLCAKKDAQSFGKGDNTVTRDEFEYLLIKYEKDIYSICIRLTQNQCEAEELFQDTWLAAMEQMHRIDFKKNPRSYLIGKAIFLWKAKKRKFARRQRIAPLINMEDQSDETFYVSETPSLEQQAEKQEMVHTLREEVRQLKDKYRIVVELHYAMDLTASQIADILKIPRGTVESRLYKARKLLRNRMEELGYEIE